MNTLSTYPSIEKSRFGLSLSSFLILGFVFFGALVCFACVLSLQAGAGAERYSAPALFDQANAYAREGKTALAIASYERAKLLAPGDPNISTNLQWVREKAGLPTPSESWLEHAVSWASPNTLACLGCLGLILAGTGILASLSFSQGQAFSRLAIFAGTLLLALSITKAAITWQKCQKAVVITPDTPAHISPTDLGETSFKLHSGELITLHGHYHDFVLVNDTAGHSGWVLQSDLASLIPESASQPVDASR